MGSGDATISLWDLEFNPLDSIITPSSTIHSLSISHDGEYLAAGTEDNFIDISDLKGNSVHKINVEGSVNALCWHPTKLYLAYTDRKGTFKIWGFSKH